MGVVYSAVSLALKHLTEACPAVVFLLSKHTSALIDMLELGQFHLSLSLCDVIAIYLFSFNC